MSLTKKYLKSRPICKVTFKLPKKAVNGAKKVQVVGDFNKWNPKKTVMKKLKDGSFTLTMELDKGKEYQFRYLIDGKKWENDWKADKYVPNGYGVEENSVVIV